jgi:hypothetical protein
MILGIIINTVGAGLLTTIGVSTSTVKWAAYMVINGLGIGMAQQLPYTALQAVLEYVVVRCHPFNSCSQERALLTHHGQAWGCSNREWYVIHNPHHTLACIDTDFILAIAVFSYQLGG